MSKMLVQSVGQKRLRNVSVVGLKKPECWAKSNVLTDDQSTKCLEILNNGELQVITGTSKRESQLLRDIATIVRQKTLNPRVYRPYPLGMIELMLQEIHFPLHPNTSPMKQALQAIPQLQKHYVIIRSLMRLRFTVATQHFPSLVEKVVTWNATIVSKDELGSQPSMVCDIEPGFYRECDAFIRRDLQGRLEILPASIPIEGDTKLEDFDEHEDSISPLPMETNQLSAKMQKQSVSETESKVVTKKNNCSTCEAFVGEGKEYREHFKSDWHKHNLKRKMKKLPPLTSEECLANMSILGIPGQISRNTPFK